MIWRDKRQADGGFTLLEMIIVLVILGLAVGIAVSRAPRRGSTIEVRGTATRLMQAMRATRAMAIARNQPVLFGLDPGRHLSQVGSDAPTPLPEDLVFAVSVGGQPARGILFMPDGSSAGGQVLLSNSKRRMTVTVDWLSGHIAVAELSPTGAP